PNLSADNFIHDHKSMRVGVALRGRDGSRHELVRRKGTKNDLLDAAGAAVDDPDGRLAGLLGGVPVEEFLRKFVIDHEEMVEGGRGVVEGRGDLGQALFAAASGVAGLGALRKELKEAAEGLYRPRASKPEINALLAELAAV